MTANYAALQVTGNNVANANTAGYSRQSVQLATSFSQGTGNGFFGKGVDVDDGDARAQRLPDPRGRDDGVARRGRPARAAASSRSSRRCSRPARPASATRRSRSSTPSSTSRTSPPTRRRARSRWRGSATWRRSTRAPRTSSTRSRAAYAGPQDLGRLDQLAQLAHRRPEPANRQRQGHGPRAERPARPARHGRQRPVAARPGDDGLGGRRHDRRVPGRLATPRPRRRGDAALDRDRSVRSDQGADRHQRRRTPCAPSPTASSPAARSPACCASRTTTSPMRAA